MKLICFYNRYAFIYTIIKLRFIVDFGNNIVQYTVLSYLSLVLSSYIISHFINISKYSIFKNLILVVLT